MEERVGWVEERDGGEGAMGGGCDGWRRGEMEERV